MASALVKLRYLYLQTAKNWALRSQSYQSNVQYRWLSTSTTIVETNSSASKPSPLKPSTSTDGDEQSNASRQQESRWRRLKRLRRIWYRGGPPPNRPAVVHDKDKIYPLDEAIGYVRKASFAKFDETLELTVRLNIDPRQAQHNLRGTFSPPHGTGRKDRIVVFAPDGSDLYEAAKQAGAHKIGLDSLIEEIKFTKAKCLKGFTSCLTTRENIPRIASKVGRILGPKGLLPSEKAGTVIMGSNVVELVANIGDFLKGKIYYRVDSTGTLHMNVGKLSFNDEMLEENIKFVLGEVLGRRPADVRKKYFLKGIICSSMGPGVQISPDAVLRQMHRSRAGEVQREHEWAKESQ